MDGWMPRAKVAQDAKLVKILQNDMNSLRIYLPT